MPTIRLDPDLAEKLRNRAQAQGRSLTNLSNLLLRRLLGMKASPPIADTKDIVKRW